MVQPLALLFYENLLPGSQIINRLKDLGYRVLAVNEGSLAELAQREKPLVIVVDLDCSKTDVCAGISSVKSEPSTAHIPVLAISSALNKPQAIAAQKAGATLVASKQGILEQLPQLLEQILAFDL